MKKPKHDLPVRVYVVRASDGVLEVSNTPGYLSDTSPEGTYELVQVKYPDPEEGK